MSPYPRNLCYNCGERFFDEYHLCKRKGKNLETYFQCIKCGAHGDVKFKDSVCHDCSKQWEEGKSMDIPIPKLEDAVHSFWKEKKDRIPRYFPRFEEKNKFLLENFQVLIKAQMEIGTETDKNKINHILRKYNIPEIE